jgi:hypothetical protein
VTRVALLVAAVLDTAWTALFVLPTGLRWPWLSFSDLEVDGRPWAWLFRACFVAADVLMVLVALTEFALDRRDRRSIGAGWLALAVFGAVSATDDLAGMTCVRQTDPDCRLAAVPLDGPWVDQVHTLASVVAVVAMLACMFAFGRAGLRLAVAWIACELGSALAVGVLVMVDGPVGVPQAVQMATEATWLVVLAAHVRRTG